MFMYACYIGWSIATIIVDQHIGMKPMPRCEFDRSSACVGQDANKTGAHS